MEESAIREAILRQYRASLAMLRQAVELCPEDLWLSAAYHNRFWHIAYHAAFYTHLYAQTSEAAFRPWPKHRPDSQYLGPRPWAPNEPRVIGDPYAKADVLDYLTLCDGEIEANIPAIRLEDASGFYWLKFNKLELQFYNIRHLQHHTGQLTDRLRNASDRRVDWVISR